MSSSVRSSIAVIGAGISGLSAAYLLQRNYKVSLFEAEDRLGGHTNTIEVHDDSGKMQAVDTGFIVMNDCNYPLLHELFERWTVDVRWSDMSFSFYDPDHNSKGDPFFYAGTTLLGLFAQPGNIIKSSFYRFLFEIARFCRDASRYLSISRGSTSSASDGVSLFSSSGILTELTLGEFLEQGDYSREMIDCYLLPMGSAIWSVPTMTIKDFPAESFFRFFRNHGLLGVSKRPRWQTVRGGSNAYLSRFRENFNGEIFTGTPIQKVVRSNSPSSPVTLHDNMGREYIFDEVVFACHADQALRMIDSPSELERNLLGAWSYQNNEAILHTDASILPPNRHAWASWNYYGRHKESNKDSNSINRPAVLTYYMNLLQGIRSETHFLVTLNDDSLIDKAKILKRIPYTHPVYTPEAVFSQSRLYQLQGQNHSYFAGSYFGNGFHEDGARSGAQVALHKGIIL